MLTFKRGEVPDNLNYITAYKKRIPVRCAQIDKPFQVQSMEGLVQGKAGDYLMVGNHGDTYICDRDIFEATYEKKRDLTWLPATVKLVYGSALLTVFVNWTADYSAAMAIVWPVLVFLTWLHSKEIKGWDLVYKTIDTASFLFMAGLLIRELVQ